MAEIKYTSDGRKVVVVGKLNAQETIVQEIFVSNNAEIPSGENFVVKSLHDAPAISWKEKNLKELEQNYDKQKKSWDEKIKTLRDKYGMQCDVLSEKLKWIASALKEAKPEDFDMLVNYIAGKCTHIVINANYGTPKLKTFAEFDEVDSEYNRGNIRLISFFGSKYNGFTYAQGRYSDSSGGSTEFKPFTNYEDALKYCLSIIEEKPYSEETILFLKKHNSPIDQTKLDEFKNRRIAEYNKQIEQQQKAIDSVKEKINSLTI